MNNEIYHRFHSAAWIAPDGEFIPLGEGSIHDDYTTSFGIERFFKSGVGSKAAIDLGYAKVSNPCLIGLDRIRANDPRLKTMAEFTANAIIEFHKLREEPEWLNSKYRGYTPLMWRVGIDTQRGYEQMFVEEFIFSFGSDETKERVREYFKMNENLIRELIQETIKHIGDEWIVYPKKGGKRLGTHKSKASALRQLRAIEISKSKR